MTDDPATPAPDDDDEGAEERWRRIEEKARLRAAGGVSLEGELVPERVGRLAQRDHLDSLPAFTPHTLGNVLCQACSAPMPADLTVCFACGAPLSSLTPASEHLLIIDALREPDTLLGAARVLSAAHIRLSDEELRGALSEPPAVFVCEISPQRARAICGRLEEIGVSARVASHNAPGVWMAREVFESIARDRRAAAQWAAALLGALLLTLYAPLVGLLVSVVGLAALYARQLSIYKNRHRLDAARLVDELSGLGEHAARAGRALGALRDDEARIRLTACLISYHAIWRQLSTADPVHQRLLVRIKQDLSDLLRQLLDACIRYGELSAYAGSYKLEALDSQLEQLEAELPQEPRARELRLRQITQRRSQRDTVAQVLDALPLLHEQLGAMAASLESLRARTVSLTLRRAASADAPELEILLFDLDEEVEVFEHTITSLSSAAP